MALAALVAFVVCLMLAAYEVADGSILGRLTSWTFVESLALRWTLAVGFGAFGVICLLVATGGFFALHEDAKEVRAAPPNAGLQPRQ